MAPTVKTKDSQLIAASSTPVHIEGFGFLVDVSGLSGFCANHHIRPDIVICSITKCFFVRSKARRDSKNHPIFEGDEKQLCWLVYSAEQRVVVLEGQ